MHERGITRFQNYSLRS